LQQEAPGELLFVGPALGGRRRIGFPPSFLAPSILLFLAAVSLSDVPQGQEGARDAAHKDRLEQAPLGGNHEFAPASKRLCPRHY